MNIQPSKAKGVTSSLLIAGLLLSFAATVPGCGDANGEGDATITEYPYKIAATVGMVADIATHVAGDKAKVTTILGEVDPHTYTPNSDDVKQLMDADVIFYVGLMLEGRMGDTFVQMARQKPVYAVTELIDSEHVLEFDGHPDPHVWMDVKAWTKCVEAVAQSLGEIDPDNASYYKQNAEAYIAELDKLDAYVRKVIHSIPEQQRVLITAHDAFNYFGEAYGIKVMGVQGMSTESEAGLERINELVRYIVDNDIRAIFVETTVVDDNMTALIEGAAKAGKEVTIGGKLFSDAMGKPGTYEGTYIGMLDHNATHIARALGGEAPAKGMQGKLGD